MAATPDTTPLSPQDARLAPWRAFVMAQMHVSKRLDDDLRAGHDLSLQEYGALLVLAEATDRRLRMSRLADELALSRSGATRLIDRLVRDGLVKREDSSSDARGQEALLTDAGLDRLRAASPTHLRGIRDYFLAAIEEADLPAIERSMNAIRHRLGSEPGP